MQYPYGQGGHGPNMPPSLPHHQQQRRDYYGHMPQSPNIYSYQYPTHQPYPQQYRYNPYHHTPQHYIPPQQHMAPPYAQRSPMVVSSQPHPQSMTPTRQQNTPFPPRSTQSPGQPIVWYAPRAVESPAQVPVSTPVPASAPTPAVAPIVAPKVDEQVEAPPPPPEPRRDSNQQNPLSLPPVYHEPFRPNLPQLFSKPEDRTFPPRANGRRRRRRNLHTPNAAVALPTRDSTAEGKSPAQPESQAPSAEEAASETSTIAAPSEPETPATSQAPSESDFTNVSTPATPAQVPASSPKPTPTQPHPRRDTRPAIAVPNIPGLPRLRGASPTATTNAETSVKAGEESTPKSEEQPMRTTTVEPLPALDNTPKTPPPKLAPKSWADLVRTNAKTQAPSVASLTNGEVVTNGIQVPKSASLADALRQYNVRSATEINYLEPRGLVNTGNMCYMNSILQVLVFCTPFYIFLDQVRQRTVHSMKSDTPLVDAMIMFMREFKPIASAASVDVLRSMLKQEHLEQYGDSVTPEYVYEVIRKLPRFAHMRRGHQQDAEEFLGFLLEGLHDECVQVMSGQAEEQPQTNGVTSPDTVMSPGSADGWLEVGPKQKAATTRTSGQQEAPSPITKIFGGHLRSELRVPGLKDSVTLEPYKPLQLDIGASHVNNIVDALKGITNTESLTGDFGGRGTTAKKQVFIDSLPPVLVLHLKRFQYENSQTGTQKIWKKVGYPLELQLPKEVFPPGKRAGLQLSGFPKYRLTSVVYHHGKSAAGGHYTVDVLRQDQQEWIRMDDTIIRRIRAEDVAEGGAEEDPRILAKALEQHKADQDMQKQCNMYQGLDEADKEPEVEKPWSEVNGSTSGHKKNWSNAAASATNGTSTPTSATGKRTPTAKKEGVRDNKVAYILLYERIRD